MDIEVKRKYFRQNYGIVKNIFNTIMLLGDFCGANQEIEKIVNITPIVEYLKDESDKLYFNYIKMNKSWKIKNKNNNNSSISDLDG